MKLSLTQMLLFATNTN